MIHIISAIINAVIGWFLNIRSDVGRKNKTLERQLRNQENLNSELTSELNSLREQVERLAPFEEKYEQVKSKLQKSQGVVKEYSQPVILVGPRAVGKSSLLAQWHAPWDYSRLASTARYKTSTVPIYDFKQTNTEPHFADPDIKTDVHIHLKLKVHDFPGELNAQKSVIDRAIQETQNLRQNTGKADLGIVLICIFNAQEAAANLSQSTIYYYNGELFARLRELVAYQQVRIEKLVLVFNKYDLLKKSYPNEDDKFLLDKCLEAFKEVIFPMRGICNTERVCEVFTSLSRETDMPYHSKGASIVLGEAARKFVEVMAGMEAVTKVIPDTETTDIIYAAPSYF
jgi:GTPase SAR1 family protein